MLEKTLENPMGQSILEEINPEYSLKDLMLKLKFQYYSNMKSQLIGKDPDAGKGWGQEEKRVAQEEMVGWHHWLCGHEVEQIPGDSGGQRSLECYNLWGHKELNTTEWLNKNKGNQSDFLKHKVTLISPHKSFWDKVLNTLA